MRLTSRECRQPLGLGVVTIIVWVQHKLWFDRRRFCSRACRQAFLDANEEEARRYKAVASLFRPP
jgi:hypothetical protein